MTRTLAKLSLEALAFVVGLALVATSEAGLARKPAGVDPLHAIADPGAPPAFTESEYDQYRRGNGTSHVIGTITLKEPPYANFHCSAPSLYPDTAHTRWLIEKWVYELDGKPPLSSGLVYPGDEGMGITLPVFLNGSSYKPDRAIISGYCQDSRTSTSVWFDHVPVGKYIFIESIERTKAYESHDSKEVTVYGPYGAAPGYIDTPHEGLHPADGFVVVSRQGLVIGKKGYRYTLDPNNLFPVAHFGDGCSLRHGAVWSIGVCLAATLPRTASSVAAWRIETARPILSVAAARGRAVPDPHFH